MRVALCQIPVSSRPAVNYKRVRLALTQAAESGASGAAPHDGQRDLRAGNTSRHTRHGRWLGP